MNKKNLILIGIVAIAGITALVVALTRGRSSTFAQDFDVENPSTVTKLFFADKFDKSCTLNRTISTNGDTVWMVNGKWEASKPLVDRTLEILHNMRIREQVNKAARPNVLKNMAAKSIKIEVYQDDYRINWFGGRLRLFPHEKLTNTYYLGSETQDMLASYMYREGDKTPYVIHIPHFRGFIAPASFATDPLLWRSHKIANLPVQKIARIELDITDAPEESFAVERSGNGFQFLLLNPPSVVNGFDTARVAQLLSSFTNLNFDEYAKVVPKAELDTTFHRAPRTILTITDIDGNRRQLKTFIKYKNPDDVLAMPDTNMYQVFDLNRLYAVLDDKDTVLIQYFVFDNILQPASFFLGKRK
ncbi:MAG: DUF4340 domain-containing protein [Bacteroidales bacterium]|nr:DUF4340 domain-containing protein [Bacteroidales bacterium]